MQKHIEELKPGERELELVFKVVSKGEPNEVTSKFDGSTHKVSDVVIGDSTGVVVMTLWDDSIENVEVDGVYKLENGYTSMFKNSLRVNVGKYGKLEKVEESIDSVNESNNVSEKEFEYRRPFRRRRFDGGSRGGRY